VLGLCWGCMRVQHPTGMAAKPRGHPLILLPANFSSRSHSHPPPTNEFNVLNLLPARSSDTTTARAAALKANSHSAQSAATTAPRVHPCTVSKQS
jgi:hypothetical protein